MGASEYWRQLGVRIAFNKFQGSEEDLEEASLRLEACVPLGRCAAWLVEELKSSDNRGRPGDNKDQGDVAEVTGLDPVFCNKAR